MIPGMRPSAMTARLMRRCSACTARTALPACMRDTREIDLRRVAQGCRPRRPGERTGTRPDSLDSSH